jgi:thioredoxin 1
LEIESIINEAPTEQLIVLDFASNNCPPCEMIAPIYHDMSELDEFDHVRFLKVNVSDYPDVAEKYGVDGWPTFLLFKNGEKVHEIVGGQAAKDGLYALVAKYSN